MYSQKDVLHVLVGKDLAVKNSGLVDEYTDLTDGQIAVLNTDNTALDNTAYAALASTAKFRLVQRSGTSLLFTPWMVKGGISSADYVDSAAAVQQVSYIGYNGTAGEITEQNSTVYMVDILMNGVASQFKDKQMFKHGMYKSSAAATQPEVAWGILENLLANFAHETPNKLIQFDMVNSGTGIVFKHDQDVTVVNGATTITCTTDVTYEEAGGSTLAVGDYIRIGSSTGGTSLTSPVYKVTGINSLIVSLDRAVVNASGTYHHGSADILVIPKATAEAALYGIKCTGLAQPFTVGVFGYGVLSFEITLKDFVSDSLNVVTYTTKASEGSGTAEQVQELQWFAQGNWGKQIRTGIPQPTAFNDAVIGTAYSLYSWNWQNEDTAALASGITAAKGTVIVAVVDNTHQATLGTVLGIS